MKHLLWLLAASFGLASAASAQVPFTLPTAGSVGFESGVRVCFKDIGSAGFTITPATGALQGIPTLAGAGTISPAGSACATSRPPNWVVETAQTQSVPPDRPYDIVMFWPGVPPNSAIVRVAFVRPVTCAATLPGSVGNASVASTGTATINLNQIVAGSPTLRGTAVFTASTTATFTAGSDIHFAAGDDLEFAFPGTANATLANIAITLKCSRD